MPPVAAKTLERAPKENPLRVGVPAIRHAQLASGPSEDDVWIRQTLAGDREAFGCLIEKYKDPLFDLACRLLGKRSEAEDVLQDSFLQAYRHLSGFNHQSKFSTWAYSIVLNRVRNRLRHQGLLKWYSLDHPRRTQEGERPFEIPEKTPGLEIQIDRKLQLEAIEREVGSLPFHYRTIFILHYFQDIPLQEIARRLNRPIGTVKVYLHRSRRLLYRQLTAQPAEISGGGPAGDHVTF